MLQPLFLQTPINYIILFVCWANGNIYATKFTRNVFVWRHQRFSLVGCFKDLISTSVTFFKRVLEIKFGKWDSPFVFHFKTWRNIFFRPPLKLDKTSLETIGHTNENIDADAIYNKNKSEISFSKLDLENYVKDCNTLRSE